MVISSILCNDIVNEFKACYTHCRTSLYHLSIGPRVDNALSEPRTQNFASNAFPRLAKYIVGGNSTSFEAV